MVAYTDAELLDSKLFPRQRTQFLVWLDREMGGVIVPKAGSHRVSPTVISEAIPAMEVAPGSPGVAAFLRHLEIRVPGLIQRKVNGRATKRIELTAQGKTVARKLWKMNRWAVQDTFPPDAPEPEPVPEPDVPEPEPTPVPPEPVPEEEDGLGYAQKAPTPEEPAPVAVHMDTDVVMPALIGVITEGVLAKIGERLIHALVDPALAAAAETNGNGHAVAVAEPEPEPVILPPEPAREPVELLNENRLLKARLRDAQDANEASRRKLAEEARQHRTLGDRFERLLTSKTMLDDTVAALLKKLEQEPIPTAERERAALARMVREAPRTPPVKAGV